MPLRNGSASASMEPMALGKRDPPQVSVTCETTVLCRVSGVVCGEARGIPHDVQRHRLALQTGKGSLVRCWGKDQQADRHCNKSEVLSSV
jgi:hypothetical protein